LASEDHLQEIAVIACAAGDRTTKWGAFYSARPAPGTGASAQEKCANSGHDRIAASKFGDFLKKNKL
jgi:hypothetical protein